jgi:glycosyltransferase involved in cell wall biosynthesis
MLVIVNAHGSEIHARNRLAEAFWPITKAYLRRAELIVVPSATFARAVVASTGNESIFVSPSGGFDEVAFTPEGSDQLRKLNLAGGAKVVGFVSRLLEQKGWRIFLDAIEHCLARDVNVYGIMLGPGRDLNKLTAEIKSRSLESRVLYLGSVPRAEMPSYFRSMSAFMFTSKIANTDTLGLVAVEALACGVPVVALDAELTREYIVPGENGVLVPEWTGAAFALGAQQILDGPLSNKAKTDVAQTAEPFASKPALHALSLALARIADRGFNAS